MNPWGQLIERPNIEMPPSTYFDEPSKPVYPKRPKPPENPWKLTNRQCQILDLTCEHGTSKATATALGVTDKTIQCVWYEIRRRMNAPTMIQAVVMWVKFRQAGGGERV